MFMANARDLMNNIARQGGEFHEVIGEERELLQATLTKMLADIHQTCIVNNIKYMMVGGTALGAIRHKGFIPWDDDIDIAMLREDWELFKEIFQGSLGDKYILEGPNYGNKDTKNTFGKVYLKNSEMVELQHINTPYCNGIYIDIFVYENMSDSDYIRIIDAKVTHFINGVANSLIYYKYPNSVLKKFYSQTYKTYLYYFTRRFLGFLFSWISHKTLCNWLDRYQSRHKLSENVTSPAGRKGYLGEVLRRSEILPFILTEFNGYQFYIMNNAHSYLEQLYGSTYMQLPPEDKRERHCVYTLSFPK